MRIKAVFRSFPGANEARRFFRRYDRMFAKFSQAGHAGAEPIISCYAGESEMTDVIRFFIDDLQERVRDLDDALDKSDRTRLATLTHQLKSAAGGYGFPQLAEASVAVEQALEVDPLDPSRMRQQTGALTALCRRVILGAAARGEAPHSMSQDRLRMLQ